MHLWQLVDMLDGLDAEQVTVAHLTARLLGVHFDEASLAPYLSWQTGGYTRNGVHRTETYEIILMAWDVGAKSLVHEHQAQTCWLIVQQGRLAVESFVFAKSADRGRLGDNTVLKLHETMLLNVGDTEPDRPELDVHRVSNAGGANERAISLHIYARPFDSCITYDLLKQKARVRQLSYSHVGPPVRRF